MHFIAKVAYNSLSSRFVVGLKNMGLKLEAYNEDVYNEKKKAYALKNPYAAKECPFVLLYYKDTLLKAFYTEDSSCTLDKIEQFLKDWIYSHAKKGYIEITQIKGNQEGRFERGHTKTFMEGCSLHISTINRWYRTSIIESIDWENNTFKTLNSTYKFNFYEDKNSQQESESAS